MSAAICGAEVLFQSTLSMRRATNVTATPHRTLEISIHALHEESDSASPRNKTFGHYFNPRSP